MALERYSPSAAAALVGVSPSTVRAWCKEFAAHLSEQANPASGKERVLLPADVAILQRIKELRTAGAGVPDILQAIAATPTGTLQPYIDAQVVNVPTAPTDQVTEGLQLGLQTIQRQIDTLEERRREDAKHNANMITVFFFGLVAGLLLAAVAIMAINAGAWLGG